MAPKTHVPSDHSRASSGDTGVPGGPPGSNPTSPNDGATSSIPGKDQLSHLGPTAATQSTRLEPKRVQPCSVPAVCLLSTCQFEASSESSISHRMCHMQVIDNTNGESIGSYVKKGIGSVKSNLAFQAFRLMDELSRAATYAAKRLSPSSPTPDAESLRPVPTTAAQHRKLRKLRPSMSSAPIITQRHAICTDLKVSRWTHTRSSTWQ